MRFVIALVVAGFVYEVVPVEVVAFIVIGVVWLGLAIYSPGTCPHCRKGVKFLAGTCHHCGKEVKDEQPA